MRGSGPRRARGRVSARRTRSRGASQHPRTRTYVWRMSLSELASRCGIWCRAADAGGGCGLSGDLCAAAQMVSCRRRVRGVSGPAALASGVLLPSLWRQRSVGDGVGAVALSELPTQDIGNCQHDLSSLVVAVDRLGLRSWLRTRQRCSRGSPSLSKAYRSGAWDSGVLPVGRDERRGRRIAASVASRWAVGHWTLVAHPAFSKRRMIPAKESICPRPTPCRAEAG